MRIMSAADLVWVATATLARESPERGGFSHDEIRRKVYELEPGHGFEDSTIRTHITTHCVADKKPDPGKHRKLHLNPDSSYRLYRPGDPYHPGRKDGKLLPDPNRIPVKYHDLLAWYRTCNTPAKRTSAQTDPILALLGVGKEMWRELGGGDKFIRELRENWYGSPAPRRKLSNDRPAKRRRAI
jgi:hypothetical protein